MHIDKVDYYFPIPICFLGFSPADIAAIQEMIIRDLGFAPVFFDIAKHEFGLTFTFQLHRYHYQIYF